MFQSRTVRGKIRWYLIILILSGVTNDLYILPMKTFLHKFHNCNYHWMRLLGSKCTEFHLPPALPQDSLGSSQRPANANTIVGLLIWKTERGNITIGLSEHRNCDWMTTLSLHSFMHSSRAESIIAKDDRQVATCPQLGSTNRLEHAQV